MKSPREVCLSIAAGRRELIVIAGFIREGRIVPEVALIHAFLGGPS